MRHVYSIIRYVPNTASGERVNIGLLAGSEATGEWYLQAVTERSRARYLGGSEQTLDAVFEYLQRLADSIKDENGGPPSEECSEEWIRDLAGRQLGVVQFSQPLPMEADGAKSAIAMLWSDLIVEQAGVDLRALDQIRTSSDDEYASTLIFMLGATTRIHETHYVPPGGLVRHVFPGPERAVVAPEL